MNLLRLMIAPAFISHDLERSPRLSQCRYKRRCVLTVTLVLLALPVYGLAQPRTLLVATADPTIRRFSLTGEDLGIFASTGLSGPVGMARDRSGNVYAANVGSGTIHKFSTIGDDLGVFASEGLHEPFGLAVDAAGSVFVSDIFDNTIRKFSSTGQDLGTIASLLGFGCPTGLVLNRSGNLLVADACSSVIREFSPSGQDLGIFAETGLSNPLGLALDDSGHLFVSNTGGPFANTIREFSPTGGDLGIFADTGLSFPSSLAIDSAGHVFVANEVQRPGQIDYSIREFSATGEDLGDFVVLSGQPLSLVITVPVLHVTTPNRRSSWGINTRQRLAWTYDGDAPQLQIDISRNGGALWDSLAVVPRRSGGSQNFYWTVTGPTTTNARLRVTAIGDEDATDVNDANIRIAPAAIEFVLPHQKSVARFGTEFRLFWKHNLGARVPVAIDVSNNGGGSWRPVTTRAETKGSDTSSFRWPVDLLPTTQARLRIRALDGSGATAMSEVFTVSAPQ